MLTLRVEDCRTYLHGNFPYEIVDNATSYKVDGFWFSPRYKKGLWDGRKRLLKKGRNASYPPSIPTGLLRRVCEALAAKGVSYSMEDKRTIAVGDPDYELFDERGRIIRQDEGQYDYQGAAVDEMIAAGRGIIEVATGGGKCLGRGTPVLMADGRIKPVEEIVDGDQVMGHDSKPRTVSGTVRGHGPLFRIDPIRGESWVCNASHVLTVVDSSTGLVTDIPLNEYQQKGKNFKRLSKQFAVGVREFATKKMPLPIDPYFVGVWLGDGAKSRKENGILSVRVSKPDPEIEALCRATADAWGADCKALASTSCTEWIISHRKGKSNRLLAALRELFPRDLTIPHEYLTADAESRAALLAGLMDTDGHLHSNCFEIAQKSTEIADGIAFLARSLGLHVYRAVKVVNGTSYHRMGISGDTDCIPTRIPRKQAGPRKQKKNVMRRGFSIHPIGDGEYFGFSLDGDGRFLLGDFTVTHNTEIAAQVMKTINEQTLVLVHRISLLHQTQQRLAMRLGMDVGIIGDGIWQPRKFCVGMVQTLAPLMKKLTDNSQYIRKTRVLLIDEVHHLESDQWYDLVDAIPAAYRYGMSATVKEGNSALLLEAQTGKIIYRVTTNELIERGVLVPPRIWIASINLPKNLGCQDYRELYNLAVVHNHHRNDMIRQVVCTLVRDQKPTLCLVRRVDHCKKLTSMLKAEGLNAHCITSAAEQTERIRAIRGLSDGSSDCIVAMDSIMGEGVDAGDIRAVVNATGGKGGSTEADPTGSQTIQFIGRGCRLSSASSRLPPKHSFDYVDFADMTHKDLRDASTARIDTFVAAGHGNRIARWSDYSAAVGGT